MSQVIDIYDWWAMDRPHQAAIIDQDDSISFLELQQWSNTIANFLVDRGVQVGDRVVALGANTIPYAALAHGVMRSGAILCSINPRSTENETQYLLEKFDPMLIIADDDAMALATNADPRLSDKVINMKKFADMRELQTESVAQRVTISPDDILVIIGTSGSTGRPKGVMWSHRSVTYYLMEFGLAEPQATDHPRLLLFAPLAVSAGYLLLMQWPAYGGTVYISRAFNPDSALQSIVDQRITSIMGVPVFLEGIASSPQFADADLSHVRVTSVGGARVTDDLVKKWMSKGIALRQIYGQTEVGGQCTINPTDMVQSAPNKCGRGMPLTRMKVVDTDGKELPSGEPGEIMVKGPGCMVGYWRDEEATRNTIIDGWIKTGDQGVMDDTGLLTFLDRLKDIIISGGLNISAAELERVAGDFPGIDEAVALAAKDDKFGETPMLVISCREDVDTAALIEHFNRQLSDYKVPRYVAIENSPLPRLSGGKIDKTTLRKKYADAHQTLPRVR